MFSKKSGSANKKRASISSSASQPQSTHVATSTVVTQSLAVPIVVGFTASPQLLSQPQKPVLVRPPTPPPGTTTTAGAASDKSGAPPQYNRRRRRSFLASSRLSLYSLFYPAAAYSARKSL